MCLRTQDLCPGILVVHNMITCQPDQCSAEGALISALFTRALRTSNVRLCLSPSDLPRSLSPFGLALGARSSGEHHNKLGGLLKTQVEITPY